MEFRAQLKNVHMSPRKMRLVRSVIRGLSATNATAQLSYMPGKASDIVRKVLRSAVANARHNFNADETALVVEDVVINKGIVMKRFRPVSKGMAHPILKRMSHVTVILEEQGITNQKTAPAKKTEIKDISADDHIHRERAEMKEEATATDAGVRQSDRQKPALDKQQQTYLRMKTQQLGGDHGKGVRRKSPSEGK